MLNVILNLKLAVRLRGMELPVRLNRTKIANDHCSRITERASYAFAHELLEVDIERRRRHDVLRCSGNSKVCSVEDATLFAIFLRLCRKRKKHKSYNCLTWTGKFLVHHTTTYFSLSGNPKFKPPREAKRLLLVQEYAYSGPYGNLPAFGCTLMHYWSIL